MSQHTENPTRCTPDLTKDKYDQICRIAHGWGHFAIGQFTRRQLSDALWLARSTNPTYALSLDGIRGIEAMLAEW